MTGQLFTHYFLTDGIRATPEWQASAADPQAFAAFRESVLERYETLARADECPGRRGRGDEGDGVSLLSALGVVERSQTGGRSQCTSKEHD